jgi:hypothetical protein
MNFQESFTKFGPSSQTTTAWSVIADVGVQIMLDKASLNVGSAQIKAAYKKPWNEVMEQVLQERAKTWEQLAEL